MKKLFIVTCGCLFFVAGADLVSAGADELHIAVRVDPGRAQQGQQFQNDRNYR